MSTHLPLNLRVGWTESPFLCHTYGRAKTIWNFHRLLSDGIEGTELSMHYQAEHIGACSAHRDGGFKVKSEVV